jgi:hypothetical protein
MSAHSNIVTPRRPLASEYAPYYETYVGGIPENDILAVLRDQRESTFSFLESVPTGKIDFAYAPGKWTLRQVFGHVLDMEWVFAARALHFARGVPGALPGVEQDDVMKVVDFTARSWDAMLDEWSHLRAANIRFFEGLDETAWNRVGVASGHPVTPRALAYIIAGHERHHIGVIRTRYLD